VSLSSIDDEGLGEELNVIWELEPGAKAFEKASLPTLTAFDDPRRLDACGFRHKVKLSDQRNQQLTRTVPALNEILVRHIVKFSYSFPA